MAKRGEDQIRSVPSALASTKECPWALGARDVSTVVLASREQSQESEDREVIMGWFCLGVFETVSYSPI